MVIKWSDFSKINLHDFIQNSKISSPNTYVNDLVLSVYLLENYPKAGKVIFVYNNIEIRQLIHKMHRIIYRIVNNEIQIGSVLHTSQNLENSLKFIKNFFI